MTLEDLQKSIDNDKIKVKKCLDHLKYSLNKLDKLKGDPSF
jgi:hypothetical protein